MRDVHITLNEHGVPDDDRRAAVATPVFGQVFTDHMVTMRYERGRWGPLELVPFAPLELSPATLALHYGQSIFEALKAYRLDDGSAALFRPGRNAARMAASAERIAMPAPPDGAFELGCALLTLADQDWIPSAEGAALYVRPFMFGSEAHLSVRPAEEYLFVIIASPVASYFGPEAGSITVGVERSDVRATPGGTGAAKFAGNYAAGFAAHGRAGAAGYDQVMWLDAVEHRWVEELNAMNVMFVWDRDGRTVLTTPPLGGTILDGVTRDSLLVLASDAVTASAGPDSPHGPDGLGIDEVRVEPTSIDQIRAGVADATLREVFACGTAAVIAPIGRLVDRGDELVVGDGTPGRVTMGLRGAMFDVQYGRVEDVHGWRSSVTALVRAAGVEPDQLRRAHSAIG